MKILVVDGQGGGIGRQLVSAIKREIEGARVLAAGTSEAATSAMRKAGADEAATGENAVRVACRKADVIVGPLGIVIADTLSGEITPKMAVAIARSQAKRVLIPFNNCGSIIAGVSGLSTGALIGLAVEEIKKIASEEAEAKGR